MLALTRRLEESIVIDLRTVDLESLAPSERLIYQKVIGISCGECPNVRIGFTAARAIQIHREETFKGICENGRRSLPRHLGNAAPKLLAVVERLFGHLHDLPELTREGRELLDQATEALRLAEPEKYGEAAL